MNLFQWLALGFLFALLLWELLSPWWKTVRQGVRLFRCLILLSAAVAIAFPSLIQQLATAIGIGRGADLVLYLFILAFLAVSFYLYARHVQLQRQLTQIVRHLAIKEARRGNATSAAQREAEV
jgi:hypothetical protein